MKRITNIMNPVPAVNKGQPSHVAMPVSLQNPQPPSMSNPIAASHLAAAKNMETENIEIMGQVQELLNQLFNRGVNSMLVTVGPLGEIGIHGSHKGQTFLKDNTDWVDRFSKLCSDDVWTLIGRQKRFMELGRGGNRNAPGQFNEKGEYPLDFSHERGNFFSQPTTDRSATQDNLMTGIVSQGMNQSKQNYPTNSFGSSPFSPYGTDNRPGYPFFQGGFAQGAHGQETYPGQSNFLTGVESPPINNVGNNVLPTPSTSGPPTTVAHSTHDKAPIQPTEEDLIKEMLNSSPLQNVFKEQGQKQKKKKEKGKKDSTGEDKKKESPGGTKRKSGEGKPETWQRSVKKLKLEGKAYINAKGTFIPAKQLHPVDCSKCKLKCQTKFTEEARRKIFDWFWKLGSYTAQKEFVISRVTQIKTKTSKRRHVHRLFSFEVNGKCESVCKPFFSKTLDISDSYICKAFEQKARDMFVQDGRGKHAPVNKTSQEQINFMHQHLDRFLAIYPEDRPLPKSIHAVKWYDEYMRFCEAHGRKYVSKHIYRKLFQDYVRKYPPNPKKKRSSGKPPANPNPNPNPVPNLRPSDFYTV